MANKVTSEDVLRINELYYKYKTYAEVARQTGFAASTVKKYVVPGWTPVVETEIEQFDIANLPDYKKAAEIFKDIINYGNLCVLTNFEREEIEKLWGELAI